MAGTIRDPRRRAEAEAWLRASRNRGFFWLSCSFAFPVLNAVVFYVIAVITDSIATAASIAWGLLLPELAGLFGFVRGFTGREHRGRWLLGGAAILFCITFLLLIGAYFLFLREFHAAELA